MSDQSSEHQETLPEPESASTEKSSIRKSQEEFVDDASTPSIDRSEYEAGKDDGGTPNSD